MTNYNGSECKNTQYDLQILLIEIFNPNLS